MTLKSELADNETFLRDLGSNGESTNSSSDFASQHCQLSLPKWGLEIHNEKEKVLHIIEIFC